MVFLHFLLLAFFLPWGFVMPHLVSPLPLPAFKVEETILCVLYKPSLLLWNVSHHIHSYILQIQHKDVINIKFRVTLTFHFLLLLHSNDGTIFPLIAKHKLQPVFDDAILLQRHHYITLKSSGAHVVFTIDISLLLLEIQRLGLLGLNATHLDNSGWLLYGSCRAFNDQKNK